MHTHTYDVIIIGSGLGGLTAAATLARAGLKVRVFEQHSLAGGYSTTFTRGRFEFEVALHAMSGVGDSANRGPIFNILNGLGVAEKIDFVPLKDVFRSITDDQDFTMPIGEEAAIDALCTLFPDERTGIRSVMKQVMGIGAGIETMRSEGEPGSSAAVIAKFPGVGHAAGVSLGRILDSRIRNPRARLAIAQLWGYFGLPPKQLSLLMFSAGMFNYINYAPVIPRQNSQALSDAFVHVIRQHGGEVTLSCPVSRILSSGDRVTGIEIAHGDRFEARVVISNICALTTLTRLMNPDQVPVALTDRLGRIPPSVSSFNVYTGLDCPSTQVGIANHELYINRGFDLDSHYRCGTSISDPESISVTAYDVLNPAACPAGTGLVTLTVLVEGAPWEKLDPVEYQDAKNRMAEWVIQSVDKRFPGYASHIETLSIATPITNARYTGNTSGAIYGFAMRPGQSPAFRLDPRGHLKGLWYAGAWTRPGGGFQAVINSGHFTANAIMREWPTNDSRRPSISGNPYASLNVQRATALERLSSLGQIFKDGKIIRNAIQENRRPARMSAPVLTSPEQTLQAVEHIHASSIETRVDQIVRESHDTVTLRLKPTGRPISQFLPGQYFTLTVDTASGRIGRPYSASSSASERNHIDVTIKKKTDGYLSEILTDHQSVGNTITLSGPWGNFRFAPRADRPDLVAIAAGSGITPFISMLRTFVDTDVHPPQMTLFVGSRSEKDVLFKSYLEETEQKCGWLRVIHVLSRPENSAAAAERGRMSPAILDKYLTRDDLSRATFLICGPQPLFTAMSQALQARDVSKSNIRTESYGPPTPIVTARNWPDGITPHQKVSLSIADSTFSVDTVSGETLLGSLERNGAAPPSRCRSNVCNSCRMELVSGKVYSAANSAVLSSPTHIRTCMCFPISDVTLR